VNRASRTSYAEGDQTPGELAAGSSGSGPSQSYSVGEGKLKGGWGVSRFHPMRLDPRSGTPQGRSNGVEGSLNRYGGTASDPQYTEE